MTQNGHPRRKVSKAPVFVPRAERALRRAAHNVKTRNRSLGVPIIVWQDAAKWWRSLHEDRSGLHFCPMKITKNTTGHAVLKSNP